MSLEELKPCPFCGGEAELQENNGIEYAVICQRCFCRTEWCVLYKQDAITAWNTRV